MMYFVRKKETFKLYSRLERSFCGHVRLTKIDVTSRTSCHFFPRDCSDL